jgi:hypothetical protein
MLALGVPGALATHVSGHVPPPTPTPVPCDGKRFTGGGNFSGEMLEDLNRKNNGYQPSAALADGDAQLGMELHCGCPSGIATPNNLTVTWDNQKRGNLHEQGIFNLTHTPGGGGTGQLQAATCYCTGTPFYDLISGKWYCPDTSNTPPADFNAIKGHGTGKWKIAGWTSWRSASIKFDFVDKGEPQNDLIVMIEIKDDATGLVVFRAYDAPLGHPGTGKNGSGFQPHMS